jgi:hypothetical protein
MNQAEEMAATKSASEDAAKISAGNDHLSPPAPKVLR